MTDQNQNFLEPEVQLQIIDEIRLQIAKRNDYEHSSVKNFTLFFERFVDSEVDEKIFDEVTEEMLEEMKMQRAFLVLDTEFSLSADLRRAFEGNDDQINYALDVLAAFSQYLEIQIDEEEELYDEYEEELTEGQEAAEGSVEQGFSKEELSEEEYPQFVGSEVVYVDTRAEAQKEKVGLFSHFGFGKK